MSKIYIVQYYCFDDECEWKENIMAFTDKDEARLYVIELEENSKKAQNVLKQLKEETDKSLEPYRLKIKKRIASKDEITEYQKLYTERTKTFSRINRKIRFF